MKRFFKSNFFLAGFFLLVIALSLSGNVFGQDNLGTETVYSFDKAIEMIGENQIKIIKIFRAEQFGESPLDTQSSGEKDVLLTTTIKPFDDCFSDYNSWNSSSEYDEDAGPFAMPFIQTYPKPLFRDVNGDGILDYYIVSNYQGPYASHYACLYTGNGTGYDLTYKCYGQKNGSSWTFYGDCAANS